MPTAGYCEFMSALIFIVAATVFGLLALRYGAESRPGFDERAPGDHFGALR